MLLTLELTGMASTPEMYPKAYWRRCKAHLEDSIPVPEQVKDSESVSEHSEAPEGNVGSLVGKRKVDERAEASALQPQRRALGLAGRGASRKVVVAARGAGCFVSLIVNCHRNRTPFIEALDGRRWSLVVALLPPLQLCLRALRAMRRIGCFKRIKNELLKG